MRLKTELRRLRVLGCEATAKSVTLHLRGVLPGPTGYPCPDALRNPADDGDLKALRGLGTEAAEQLDEAVTATRKHSEGHTAPRQLLHQQQPREREQNVRPPNAEERRKLALGRKLSLQVGDALVQILGPAPRLRRPSCQPDFSALTTPN